MYQAGRILSLGLLIPSLLGPSSILSQPAARTSVPYRTAAGALVLTSFSALNAKQNLEAIRSGLKDLLSGHPGASLESLAAGLDAVEARLSDRSMTSFEASLLMQEVSDLRGLLALARNGSRSSAQERLSRLGSSFRPDSAFGTGSQILAARDSVEVAKVFDNNRFQAGASAVPFPAIPPGTRSSSFAFSAPQARAKDIQLQVPAMGKAQASQAPAQASSAAPQAAPKIERLSRHILRVTAADGKASLEVGLADLLRRPDAAARTALSREIAAEIFAALGRKDERLSEALADFLRDIAEYMPAGAKAARLSVDSRGHFSLIFDLADGGRRILTGQFLPSSGPGGQPGRPGFIVMRPIELDASGAAKQDGMGYWREYLAGGRRQEWSATLEKEERGWGLWAHENDLQKVWLAEQSWVHGGWRQTRKENAKTLTLKEGKSWLGNAGDKVMKTPVVGRTLKFCDDVGATLFTGISAAPQVLISAVSDSDTYGIEAAGTYAHNPLMRALVDEQGFLDRLTPGARKELFSQVRFNRLQALQSHPFPLPPDLMRQAVDAPINAKEAFETLRGDYGMGSYGKRLVHEGTQETGWRSTTLKAGGVAVGVFENVGDAVFNPIMWAMMGTGEAAAAIKGAQAFTAGAVGAKTALTAVQAARMVATAAWWGPWLISSTDNLGRLVRLTNEGKFDKAYYKNIEEVSADLIYLFLIP